MFSCSYTDFQYSFYLFCHWQKGQNKALIHRHMNEGFYFQISIDPLFPTGYFPSHLDWYSVVFFGIFRSYVRGTARLRFVYCTNYIVRLVAFPTFGNSISSGWCVTARRKMWYSLPCRTGCYSDFDIISFRCGMSMLQILISMPIGGCSIRQVS